MKNSLSFRNVSAYLVYEQIFLHVLQGHIPIEQALPKQARANHAPYVTKAMRKAVMKENQLQDRYF